LTDIKILATGSDFLKQGVRANASVTEEVMKNVADELHILAYVISNDAEFFLKLLEDALERSIATTLVINNLKRQDERVQKKFKVWQEKYPYFKLIDFNRKKSSRMQSKYHGTCSKCGGSWTVGDNIFYQNDPKLSCKEQKCFESNGGKIFQIQTLHAKVIVADRKKAILGSANFSWGGMSSHYEIGVLLEGKDAWTLSELVDEIAS
jgi:phosphatidylserine/phosphatidylglycerophosphate/cardiolipin synthase-like enzyme